MNFLSSHDDPHSPLFLIVYFLPARRTSGIEQQLLATPSLPPAHHTGLRIAASSSSVLVQTDAPTPLFSGAAILAPSKVEAGISRGCCCCVPGECECNFQRLRTVDSDLVDRCCRLALQPSRASQKKVRVEHRRNCSVRHVPCSRTSRHGCRCKPRRMTRLVALA
jgi:hypothetical protein